MLTIDEARIAALVEQSGNGFFEMEMSIMVSCTIPTQEEREQIARFFFWTAWVASAARPGKDYSYTDDWPAERSIGNVATTETYIWTIGGIVSLFVTLGLFIFWVHRDRLWYGPRRPLAEKLVDMPLTPSQMKAAKYFLVVILLFLVQTAFGGLLAHFTVHPGTFYIPIIGQLIPYSWAKSWHLQIAIFWIARPHGSIGDLPCPDWRTRTAQAGPVGPNIVCCDTFLVAVGSSERLPASKDCSGANHYGSEQPGWEYLELGRLWQILLFVGLIAWLFIVYRAVNGKVSKNPGPGFQAP